MHSSEAACRIGLRSAAPVLEFIAYQWPTPRLVGMEWPEAPGAVRHDSEQRPELLHFAPGRWLAPGPAPALVAMLDAAASAGAGSVVDATGKWDPFDIAGPGAARLLASTIGSDALLAGRRCAAALLFDCPSIIARQDDGFALWVQSSYSADFMATAQRMRAALWPQS